MNYLCSCSSWGCARCFWQDTQLHRQPLARLEPAFPMSMSRPLSNVRTQRSLVRHGSNLGTRPSEWCIDTHRESLLWAGQHPSVNGVSFGHG